MDFNTEPIGMQGRNRQGVVKVAKEQSSHNGSLEKMRGICRPSFFTGYI